MNSTRLALVLGSALMATVLTTTDVSAQCWSFSYSSASRVRYRPPVCATPRPCPPPAYIAPPCPLPVMVTPPACTPTYRYETVRTWVPGAWRYVQCHRTGRWMQVWQPGYWKEDVIRVPVPPRRHPAH